MDGCTRDVRAIREGATRRVLSMLEDLAEVGLLDFLAGRKPRKPAAKAAA